MTTPNIGLTELSNSAGQYLNANETFAVIDALLQARAISKSLTSAPVGPGDGDVYIMASAWPGITTLGGASCAAGDIALYRTGFGAFKAIRPKEGWKIEVAADDQEYRFDGTTWIAITGGGGVSLPVIRAITASESLGLSHINTFGVNSTTSNYTQTIPAQAAVAWTADAEIHFLPSNTGDITITAAAGVSLNGVVAGSVTLSTQNGAASIKRTAADTWWIGGAVGTPAEQRTALGLGSGDSPTFAGASSSVSTGNPRFSLLNTALTIPNYSATGFNPVLEAGEVGRATASSSGSGGLVFNGFTNNTATSIPVIFAGHHGSVSPTVAAISFAAFKHDGATNRQALAASEIVAQFSNGTTARLQCLGDGTWRPVGDNTQPLGGTANRWSVVYAGTGTINTSDAREKTPVRGLSDAEIAAAKQLAKEIGVFKFLSAIQQKGDAAREHVGMAVQRAIEIMELHDLDPFNYGFICHDIWEEQLAVLDEDENETVPYRAAGDRYGFRTDELLLFIARGFEARLAALESPL